MEFLEDIRQLKLIALVGIDEYGERTVVSICTGQEIPRAIKVILDSWPSTIGVAQYTIELHTTPGKPDAQYERAETEAGYKQIV